MEGKIIVIEGIDGAGKATQTKLLKEALEKEVKRILGAVGTRPGYIFNLGHGILPETPMEMARHLVKIVQNGL